MLELNCTPYSHVTFDLEGECIELMGCTAPGQDGCYTSIGIDLFETGQFVVWVHDTPPALLNKIKGNYPHHYYLD